MRPLRILLSLSTSFIAVALLIYTALGSQQDEQLEHNSAASQQGGVRALFSFTSPGSLFPPSAIISLTDDNSTFFLARPAAFGPSLPKDGLSSPLWTGSGFGDDDIGKGELGCSDDIAYAERSEPEQEPATTEENDPEHNEASTEYRPARESAGIKGKIALLKRGGCGFLAKVQWAQNRGAVAVIIGDNVRGGPLIHMYAQGDTSNVSIPSLFTSYTTAHLLSSLLPPSSMLGYVIGQDTPETSSSLGADGLLNHLGTLHDQPERHKGLWVTLTPTNVSASPFFDTLLVLVVSPLVTLTVVYALLLLRSRIRRRRWRAPKSLVERLPVRTYQTISDSVSSATPHASSPTTPLLQHTPSQATSSVPELTSEIESGMSGASSSSHPEGRVREEEEKRESGLAEWRRRYGGRQRECVVCLEEYEDGVSQVMSLPCGHEFHASCITPWLVTRRRTCPICKGDVVRSLAQSYHDRQPSLSPTRSLLDLRNIDDVQAQAAETRNDSVSASLPMPVPVHGQSNRSEGQNEDVEAQWNGDNRRPASGDHTGPGSNFSSSVRDLSSTVSTVIWRGFEAVRNTANFQPRRSDEEDRSR